MDFGLGSVISILGALAFFVFGMKTMSDGIQRAAGSQLRNILRTMTKNRFLGVFTGFLTTALLQSSSATTVMTVSFVNAGLLTLVESAGIMMGANIGTTITGWIVALLGFKLKLSAYSIPLFALGVPLLFSGKAKLKYWGEFVIGFAILFLGLTFLKDSVPDLQGNTDTLDWIQNVADYGFISRVLFVFIGALVTIIVQSSSAAMAITLTLVYTGWLPLEVAAAMILGENIGTTITAEIASVVGNTNAKRSARIHSLFNIIGVTWMIILMPVVLNFISGFVESFTHLFEDFVKTEENLSQNEILNTYKLAAFHTTFNLLNVLLMLPFVSWLVKIATKTVKDNDDEEDKTITHITTGTLTPELATVELQKEAAHFGMLTTKITKSVHKLINVTDNKTRKKQYKKLSKIEENTDIIEQGITEYITKLSSQEITPKTSLRLRSILNISNDLERIGDIGYRISKNLEKKNEENIYFLPEQREGLNEMIKLLDTAFATMMDNLNSPSYDNVELEVAQANEVKINELRNELRSRNLSRIGTEDYNVRSAMVYNNLFSDLERIGDHIINVSESVTGKI